MIDHRIHTFLKLCELGNYRKTAEALNMTQPAVTQHIHFLEDLYGFKLFIYQDRKLSRTKEGEELEKHALATVYNDENFKKSARKPKKKRIAIGATKTIGEYAIEPAVLNLLANDKFQIELIIDNTKNLLSNLHDLKLDILLLEGYFNKNEYAHSHIKSEKLVGICSFDHPFANKSVAIEEIFSQHLIAREEGSGTRSIFQQTLKENGYSFDSFENISTISSFKLIEKAVLASMGISFVYQCIPDLSKDLATFTIQNIEMHHEFNFVHLKNDDVAEIIQLLKNDM